MPSDPPHLIVIAGPNGAGKSTVAPALLPDTVVFVNADEIAKTLPGYPSPGVDMRAGRILLQRLDELAQQRADMAVETTLASRTLANRIRQFKSVGYHFHLIYVWIPDANLSVARVVLRVQSGGHPVPEETIRRRYKSGLVNFFRVYRPLADTWGVYRNIQIAKPELIAEGSAGGSEQVYLPDVWDTIKERDSDA
jgi:predicted ABC-type ATPase